MSCGGAPATKEGPRAGPHPAQADGQTNDRGAPAAPQAQPADVRAAQVAPQGDDYAGNWGPKGLSPLLGRCIVRAADDGHTHCAVRLLRLPMRLGCPRLACSVIDSIACGQGRPDVLARLIKHLMAKQDMHKSLQLVMALLRERRVEALCGLCCKMARSGHVTQAATLLAETARRDCHEELAALMLYMVRTGRLEAARDIFLVMLVNKHEDATGLVLLQMLQRGGARELAQLCAALIDVSAVTMACNAERALLRWELARGYPVGTVCIELIRMGRVDVMARMLMELLEKDLMSLVVTAVAGLSSEDAVKAVVQVSLTMASMDRPDVMTDIKLALMKRGRLDIVTRCTEACIEMGHTWVAAVMTLELMRKGELGMEADIIQAVAEDGRVDLLAKWMGVLTRGGHAREWADIAAELHRRDQYWILADIIAELVPIGRAAVEAQKAVFDYYGPALCADIHILMVDRDKLDQACQLTAASVSNKHEKVVVDIMTSIIDDRNRVDAVAKKILRLCETSHDSLVVALNNALIKEGRFEEGAKLAAALAQLTPVLPLLDRLREAGATIMPEVWHYITAAQITPGVVVPPEEAPSPAHAQSSRWGDHGPDVLEDAGWSTGGSQGAAPAVKTPAVDETGHSLVLDSQPEGMEHAQHYPMGETERRYMQPSVLPDHQPTGSELRPHIVGSPPVVLRLVPP